MDNGISYWMHYLCESYIRLHSFFTHYPHVFHILVLCSGQSDYY
jgi:hypothetical protein